MSSRASAPRTKPSKKTAPTNSRHLDLTDEFGAPDEAFPRISYEDALERINATGELDEQLVWGDDLSTEAEKALGDDVGGHYFITDWPSEIKPFYIKDHDDDPQLSTGFDLMHPRMELVSGGQREHRRHEKLIEGFEQQGLDPDQFEYYTKMFKYGMPPHAGFGLGGERLVMTLLGLDNIREAVLFERSAATLAIGEVAVRRSGARWTTGEPTGVPERSAAFVAGGDKSEAGETHFVRLARSPAAQHVGFSSPT